MFSHHSFQFPQILKTPCRPSLRRVSALLICAGLVMVQGSALNPLWAEQIRQPAYAWAQSPDQQPESGSAEADTEAQNNEELWANLAARSTDPDRDVNLSLGSVSGGEKGAPWSVDLTIDNDSSQDLSDLQLRVQTRHAVTSTEEVRQSLIANEGEYPYAGSFISAPGTIAAGESASFRLIIPQDNNDLSSRNFGEGTQSDTENTPDGEESRLIIPGLSLSPSPSANNQSASGGVYPFLINLNAVQGDQSMSYIAAARSFFRIPTQNSHTHTPLTQGSATQDVAPTPASDSPSRLSFIWPLSANVPMAPGATGEAPKQAPLVLSNESLTEELEEGGRLRDLLDTYNDALSGSSGADIRRASCLAIDPYLVDTVSRMAEGYFIASEVSSPVKQPIRLRDSWSQFFRKDSLPEGRGAGAAQSWLNDLRTIATQTCTIALPWAAVDIDSLAQTNNEQLAHYALSRGEETLRSLLGVEPQRNIIISPSGQIDNKSLSVLKAAMESTSISSLNSAALPSSEVPAQSAAPSSEPVTSLSPHTEPHTEAIGNNPAPTTTPTGTQAHGSATTPESSHIPLRIVVSNNALVRSHPPALPFPSKDAEKDSSRSEESGESDASDLFGESEEAQHGNALLRAVGEKVAQSSARDSVRIDSDIVPAGVYAIPFSDQLGAALYATGDKPELAPYTSSMGRTHLSDDSSAARMDTALAVLDQELLYKDSVFAVPPARWSINKEEAQHWLDALSDYLSLDSVEAEPISDHWAGTEADPYIAQGSFQEPYPALDPGVLSSNFLTKVQATADEAQKLTEMMSNDDHIALTREEFTRPLFQELVASLSTTGLRYEKQAQEDRAQRNVSVRRTMDLILHLRNSVSLLPPGSIFSRTSSSSPLFVVARNPLPLPVMVELTYDTSSREKLITPPAQKIPAQGSITVQLMPTSEAPDSPSADIKLWLSTPEGETISDPVSVRMQTIPGVTVGSLLIILAIGGVLSFMGYRFFSQRK